jgi:hypothetical protein
MRTIGIHEIDNKTFCIEISENTGKLSVVVYSSLSRMSYPCDYDMSYARSLRKMKIIEAKKKSFT